MKNFLLIISILYFTHVKAQTYEGKIGSYNIFLDLDIDYNDDRATAFYFYNSQLQNIQLDGNYNGSELILFEQYSTKEEQKELFTLSINEDKVSGNWQNNGKTLTVYLTKTTKNIDVYKLAQLKFIRDTVTKYNNKELVWFTEKYSKKQLFRLGNGFTKSERDFMNPILDSIHTENSIIGLDCSWADFNIEIELISDQYISFSEYSSIYCGGAHPSHGIKGYNFDLKNKTQLNLLTDVYTNLNHYELLKEKYENDTDLQPECEYFTDNGAQWEYYSWVFTPNGISITPYFPHAMTPCKTGFPLTYEELKQ